MKSFYLLPAKENRLLFPGFSSLIFLIYPLTKIKNIMNTIHSINADTITFQIAETENMILAAKHLCHDVYLEVGYIKKPLANRIISYEHDASSSYIVALN